MATVGEEVALAPAELLEWAILFVVAICDHHKNADQMLKTTATVPVERIESRILLIRGHKVMLDSDLSELYGVSTKRLNEQVKRNKERFAADFMFKLTAKKKAEVVANCDHLQKLRFSPALPYAFTEHGATMAASVLNTARAIGVSVYVVRAFVKLREVLGTHKELAQKLVELERRIEVHDEEITALFEAIRQLMAPDGSEASTDRIPRERSGMIFGRAQTRVDSFVGASVIGCWLDSEICPDS